VCKKSFAAYSIKRKFFKSPFRPILLRKIGLNGDLKRVLCGRWYHQMKSGGFLHNPRKFCFAAEGGQNTLQTAQYYYTTSIRNNHWRHKAANNYFE
jgi:hypothetical protein